MTKFVHTPSASSKRKASEVLPRAAGDLSSCPRWLAFRERILEKMCQRDSAAQVPLRTKSCVVCCISGFVHRMGGRESGVVRLQPAGLLIPVEFMRLVTPLHVCVSPLPLATRNK